MQVCSDRYVAEVSRRDGYNLRTVVDVVRNGEVISDSPLPVTGGNTDESLGDNIRSSFSAEIVDQDGIMPQSSEDPLWPGGVHVRLRSGPRFGDGTSEMKRRGEYRLTSIRGTGNGRISISGKDLGYTLATPLVQPYVIEGGIEMAEVITGIALKKNPGLRILSTTTGFLSNAGVVDTDMNPLDEMVKLGAHSSIEVFFNLDGQLQLSPMPEGFGAPVWDFSEGENATFWDPEREINTEDVPSAVIVEATHSGLASPLRVIVYDNNPKSPTYYSGDYGSVVHKISSEKISTREQALKLGYQYLQSKRWLERYTFGCSPISALMLGDTITLTHKRLKLRHKRAVIESISYPLSPGPMVITATSRRVLDMTSLTVDG